MADSIVGGLFGTPEAYQQQQNKEALAQAVQLGQLDPFSSARTSLIYGGRQLAGALGGQDPQLQLISQRNAILRGVNMNDANALQSAASQLANIGDMQGAYGISELAQKRAESEAAVNLREAQAIKASMAPKLTGDERYIAQLNFVENKLRQGKEPTNEELSLANIAAQMLAKPRSFFDQASGQTVVVPATDPSKAFPMVFKQFGGEVATPPSEKEVKQPLPAEAKPSTPTIGMPTVQQATKGNLPAGVIQDVGEIDQQLLEIKNRAPQLQTFLDKIKNGDVKYDLGTNSYDIVGSIIPPIWGGKEFGKQVDKDEIKSALTARVNSVLNSAKGVQAKDDAIRAEQQIASPSTYLSSDRMAGAIQRLQKAEASLSAELMAKKQSLQSRGQSTAPTTPTAPKGKSGELSRDEKIDVFIRANNGKPTRQQAEEYLKSKNLIN
jgi:hypothetical protein